MTAVFGIKLQVSPDGINQILLNKEGDRLLVRKGPTTTVWSQIQDTNSEKHGTSISSPDTEWFHHPKDSSLLLAFKPTHVRIHRWNDLSEVAVFDIPNGPSCSNAHGGLTRDQVDDSDQAAKISSIFSNASGSHLLVDIVKGTDAGQGHCVSIVQTSTLKPSSERNSLSPSHIPSTIQQQIEVPLGLLPKQRMIFLDKDYWMCSWRVGANAASEKVQRYYCLPKDWLNIDCLKLCALLADGRFLIPNNGELGVIKSAAISQW